MSAEIIKFTPKTFRKPGAATPRRSTKRTCAEREIETEPAAEVAAARRAMPMGGDTVYRLIAQHARAVAVYDRCVDAENDTEGQVSDEELEQLARATSKAYDDVMFFARCLIIDVPTTRTGLLRWTRYMRKLLVDWRCTNSGSPYLPDKIGDEPWINTFFKILAVRLTKMGNGTDDQRRSMRIRNRQRLADHARRQ